MNVVYLLRGQFGFAWKMHAQSLEAQEDIESVQAWVSQMQKDYPQIGTVQLVAGMFLAQSGQSENSLACYQEAIRLSPELPIRTFFWLRSINAWDALIKPLKPIARQ